MSYLLIFLVTAGLGYVFSRLAPSLGLMSEPGEHRHHDVNTPVVGGLAIFGGLWLASALLPSSVLPSLIPALALICFVGAVDDRYKLSAAIRFISQATAAVLMIWLTGTQLHSLGAVFGLEEFNLNAWSIPVTIFAVMGVINALNMSDGLDGLAASIVLLIVLALSVVAAHELSLLLAIGVTLLGFLIWNLRLLRPRAALFMGDAGSTMLGLLLAYLLIDATQGVDATLPPVTALWFILLPLFDAVGVLLIRPLRGQSPFQADRIHYHHLLQRLGLKANQTLLIILLLQAIIIVNALLLKTIGVADRYQFSLFVSMFVLYLIFLVYRTQYSFEKSDSAHD